MPITFGLGDTHTVCRTVTYMYCLLLWPSCWLCYIVQGGSSLTALLPQPKGAVRTLGGANKTTKSSMVPYSLMKKRQQAKAAMKSKAAKMKAKKDNNTSDGSDSDEDPVSFFTHLEVKPDVQSHSGTISQSDSDTTGQSSITPVVNAVKEYPPMNEDTGSISLGEATSYQATTDYSQLYSYAGQYDTDVPSYGNYSQGMQEYPSEGDGSVQGWYSEQYAGTEMTQQQGETIMPGVGPGLSVDEDVVRKNGVVRCFQHNGICNKVTLSMVQA